MNARLVLERKEGSDVSFQLSHFPVTLGRDATNDITLSDNSVSRRHAKIIISDSILIAEDLGSANGTFVNEERIESSPIRERDRLRLGNCVFSVESDDTAASSLEALNSDWDLSTHSISADELVADTTMTGGRGAASVGTVLGFFQQAGRILESAFELDDILPTILNLAFEMIPAERGFVLLADPDSGDMAIAAQKMRGHEATRGGGNTELSTTILDHATKKGRAVLTTDAKSDDRFGAAQSVIIQEIRGAMCVPLKGREEILGAIYLDSSVLSHKFSLDDLKLLTAVGAQIGIAVENARLYELKIKTERLAAVGQAVAGLGHCIKNILNGMEGGSFILQKGIDKGDDPSVRKGWDILKRNSSRLKDLVLDMLTYSKPREPIYEMLEGNTVPCDVVELLEEKAAKKGVQVSFAPDPNVGQVTMDGKAIYRCVLNLAGNAVDASPPETGRVRVATERSADGDRFLIKVSDNGCGIEEDDLPKLGRAFFSTKGSQGTGLGLSVTYKIIAEHQGTVSVASELGEGTTFTVDLPARGANHA